MVERTGGKSGAPGGVERRRGGDRRGRPTSFPGNLLGPRRRRGGRRAGERRGIYVDRLGRRDVLLVLAIFALNLLDAGLTLDVIQRGGGEANPLMNALLRASHRWFLWEKCFLAGACLVALAVHKTFPLARLGLWALLGVYAGVFVYHLALRIP